MNFVTGSVVVFEKTILIILLSALWYDFRVIIQPLALGIFTPYAIILSCCAGAGIYLSSILRKDDYPFVIERGIGISALALLGSRIWYVIENLAYYLDRPSEIPQFWAGGLSWTGAILGAALAVVGIHLLGKEPLGEIADLYLPLLGMTALGIWLAGWGAGIGYGPATDAWYGIPVRDLFGSLENRWPLPIAGGLLSGAWTAGAILYPLKRTHPSGTRALLALAGLMGINGLASFWRVNPAPELLGLRLESWISLLLLAASTAGLIYLTREKKDREGSAA